MRSRLACRLLVFSVLAACVHGQFLRVIDETPEIIKDSATVTKDWKKLENLLRTVVNDILKALMPVVIDNIQDVNISSTCMRDALQLFGGIRKLQTWAMRFVDSSAKGIDGIITGSFVSYGAYDECLDTVAINQRSGKGRGEVMFRGKYCVVRIKPSLPPKKSFYKLDEVIEELKDIYKKQTVLSELTKYAQFIYYAALRLAVCVPSGCSVNDLNAMLAKVANFTNLYVKIKRCEVKEDLTFTPLMIFVICVYSSAGLMVLFGTMVDAYFTYSEGKSRSSKKFLRLLLVFSLISNFRKFVDTTTSSKHLSCLNGIRFMTIAWIILGHFYLMQVYPMVSGLLYGRLMMEEFAFQVVMNAMLSVETFFFISGMCVCYVTVTHIKIGKKKFSVVLYIVHRLFRILPAYVFAILFVFIMETLTSGPSAYTIVHPFVEACEKNWWTNLLFINNFYKSDDMCLPHAWYLSVDMQFYLGALIILLPLLRWPKVGISIAVICIIGFITSCGILTYIRGYPPTGILSDPDAERMGAYLLDFYAKPYPHGGSYIIGILVGYLLAMKPKLKIPKVILWFGWSTAIICCMSTIYGTYEWNRGREATVWEAVLYGSLHKTAWTVGVAWMVVCCAYGHGGIINYILSWKVWIPLGRLTFMAYLVHPYVEGAICADMRQTLPARHTVGVWWFFGHLMASFGVAFLGNMLIEAPMLSLEKICFPQRDKKCKSKSENPDKQAGVLNVIGQEEAVNNANVNWKLSTGLQGSENGGFVYKL